MFRNLILLIIFLTLLSGCSIQQRMSFHNFCSSTHRTVIHDTVKVKGYLSADEHGNSCRGVEWMPIVVDGYDYHECTTSQVNRQTLPILSDIYRFTIELEGSPLCKNSNEYYSYHQKDTGNKLGEIGKVAYFINDFKDQLKGKCLVIQKVFKPKSRYVQLHERAFFDDGKEFSKTEIRKKYDSKYDRKHGTISISRTSIIDMETNKLLSQYNNYYFYPLGRVNSAGLSLNPECDGDYAYINANKVLIPE